MLEVITLEISERDISCDHFGLWILGQFAIQNAMKAVTVYKEKVNNTHVNVFRTGNPNNPARKMSRRLVNLLSTTSMPPEQEPAE
jgi:hypothetical protein